MDKHTGGTWRYDATDNAIIGDRYVCNLSDWAITGAGGGYDEANAALEAEREANALRIVACVNACAGMVDPMQEISCDRQRAAGVPAMCAEVEALRSTNAGLMKALRRLANEAEARAGVPKSEIAEARAALANVEVGQ